jgi:hypothetical protein
MMLPEWVFLSQKRLVVGVRAEALYGMKSDFVKGQLQLLEPFRPS